MGQFNALRTQLDQAARDAGFNGTNLLAGDSLSIAFNEKTGAAKSKLDIQGTSLSSSALGIGEFKDSATAQSGPTSVSRTTRTSPRPRMRSATHWRT